MKIISFITLWIINIIFLFKWRIISRNIVFAKVRRKVMLLISCINYVPIFPIMCAHFLIFKGWETISTPSALILLVINMINENLGFLKNQDFDMSIMLHHHRKMLLMLGKWFINKTWERTISKESLKPIKNRIEHVTSRFYLTLLKRVLHTQLYGHKHVE